MYKFFSILEEEGEEEAVMVKFNTKMKGQDQIEEKGSPDVTDVAPLLIKVCCHAKNWSPYFLCPRVSWHVWTP